MTEMLKSKKFVAAMIGVIAVVLTTILAKVGLAVSEESVLQVLGLLAVYILGQGAADFGKSAATAAPVTTVPVPPVVTPAKATLSTKKGALVDTLK
jgi:hypothetical protein